MPINSLPYRIARRYLFARKKKNVVNIISWISLIGIAVGTAALIVVLSVYNGIGELTQELFNVFDAELVVEPASGKTFHLADMDYEALCNSDGIVCVSQIAEENAWITNKQNESIVQLRGVDSNYAAMTGLDTLLHEGTYVLRQTNEVTFFDDEGEEIPRQENVDYLLFGGEVYYNLGIATYSNSPVAVHIPKRGGSIGLSMDEAFNNGYAYPAGYFYIQQDIDASYVVAHIDFVRSLMDYDEDEVTALAIETDGHTNQVKDRLRDLLGDNFRVKDRFDQQPLYYKVFKSERLGVILILSLIVLIATLNLVASLSLLIIDKRHDISIMKSMGMSDEQIRHIFFDEGLMIAAVGVVAGLIVGFLICLAQKQFGLIKMGGGNFVVQAFPVAMKAGDFVLTFLLVLSLCAGSVFLTVRQQKRAS